MPQIISPPESKTSEKCPIITTCPHCQYTISYTEDEVERVENGGMGVLCPNCNESIVLEYIKPFTFPDTFYHFGAREDSVCLPNEEVQKYVDIVKRRLQQELKTGDYTSTGTGGTLVIGFKLEDEDTVVVAKNYWIDSIFKE